MASENELSLGEFLRQEREHRGITIEQVASATKVGVRTLHALEGDLYAELPAKPFVRGFVNSYCRFIGLDSKETLARFDQFINQKGSERPNRESGHSGYAFEKKDSEQQSRTILLIAIFGFICAGGIVMVFVKPSLRHHRNSHIEKLRAANEGVSLGPAPSPTPTPLYTVMPVTAAASPVSGVEESQGKEVAALIATPVPLPSSAPMAAPVVAPAEVSARVTPVALSLPTQGVAGQDAADPLDSGRALPLSEIRHKVSFKVLADVWVRYQVDERPIRKFIIRKGKMLVLKAKDGVKFQVSNLNSIAFNYNGKTIRFAKNDPHMRVINNSEGLFFPKEVSTDPSFLSGGDVALPKTPDPLPEQNNPTPVPSP